MTITNALDSSILTYKIQNVCAFEFEYHKQQLKNDTAIMMMMMIKAYGSCWRFQLIMIEIKREIKTRFAITALLTSILLVFASMYIYLHTCIEFVDACFWKLTIVCICWQRERTILSIKFIFVIRNCALEMCSDLKRVHLGIQLRYLYWVPELSDSNSGN